MAATKLECVTNLKYGGAFGPGKKRIKERTSIMRQRKGCI